MPLPCRLRAGPVPAGLPAPALAPGATVDAAVEATDDGLVIRFADEPPGAGTYQLRVRLGLRERAQPVGALGAW